MGVEEDPVLNKQSHEQVTESFRLGDQDTTSGRVMSLGSSLHSPAWGKRLLLSLWPGSRTPGPPDHSILQPSLPPASKGMSHRPQALCLFMSCTGGHPAGVSLRQRTQSYCTVAHIPPNDNVSKVTVGKIFWDPDTKERG